jgi:uncharacterized protein
MSAAAAVQSLAGDRLHLSHGLIDVVLRAWGAEVEVRRAHEAVVARFATVLPELAGERDELRRPIAEEPRVEGAVARRMVAAVRPFAPDFITPMAAVAGSVADELLAAMLGAAVLEKAFVNDGGDIAIHLSPGERLAVGIAGDFAGRAVPGLNGAVMLRAEDGIGGIATSGFNGRSFTLGIADSVTVVAASAAAADAAATIVANAVDLDSPAIERRPASALDPDSDLCDRLVTSAVGPLSEAEIWQALTNGRSSAERLIAGGLIGGAALMLRGQSLVAAAPGLAARLASQARDG